MRIEYSVIRNSVLEFVEFFVNFGGCWIGIFICICSSPTLFLDFLFVFVCAAGKNVHSITVCPIAGRNQRRGIEFFVSSFLSFFFFFLYLNYFLAFWSNPFLSNVFEWQSFPMINDQRWLRMGIYCGATVTDGCDRAAFHYGVIIAYE